MEQPEDEMVDSATEAMEEEEETEEVTKAEMMVEDTTADATGDSDKQQQQDEAPSAAETTTTTTSGRGSRKRLSRSSSRTNSPVSETTTTTKTTSAAQQQQKAASVSAQAAAAAAQAALSCGMTGLYTLLLSGGGGAVLTGGGSGASAASTVTLTTTTTTTSSSSSSSQATLTSSSSSSSSSNSKLILMPSLEQVQQAATRAVNDAPPYVHLSSRDSAPQLKMTPETRRLVVRGGEMRGYRMARATHGVSEGNYYYEVLVLQRPTARELVASLPPNVRLGRNLQKQLQEQLVREEQQQGSSVRDTTTSSSGKGSSKKRKQDDVDNNKSNTTSSSSVGGHVRIGWSMRTGDLQAPVGYDKWSYGLRDIAGSRIHNSRREDKWGGVPFGPGDVVGFCISLVGADNNNKSGQPQQPPEDVAGGGGATASSSTAAATASSTTKRGTASSAAGGGGTNHIRFFKNGEAMGHFIVSRGKREGGAAFDNIEDGTYYPAISAYMGGSVRVNFGPYFCYPPRLLPSGMKVKPVSDLCPPPPSPEEAVTKAMKDVTFSKKTDESIVTAFREAIQTEAQIRHDAYTNHLSCHVEEVRNARQERNLSTSDLPPPASSTPGNNGDEVADMVVEDATDAVAT